MNWEKVAQAVKRVDWALLLAGLVEVPRWGVAFRAIHEPMVFGVPLAIIITWSMSAGWELYFRKPQERLILAFNIIALVISTVIITPVLYLLTQAGTFQVVMTDFRMETVEPFRLVWALALALGTFLPLISLAAVRSRTERKEEPAPRKAAEPVAAPVPVVAETVEVVDVPRLPAPKPEPDDRKRMAWQMAENGVTQEEIAAACGVTTRTVRNWLKDA
jgi:hypothetical protein